MELVDPHGRTINYLRLSVTDRCNLRCRYCMPVSGTAKLTHCDILSYEELYHIAECAVRLGIGKIRITGGEPLVRKGLTHFLARLASLPGLRQLVLTTNGLLLPEMADELRKAGVQRLNISIDSLRQTTFEAITCGGELRRVLEGIAAAGRAGFPPVKLNMVVMRGVNDMEILDFAALTLDKPYTVRFIEYMPSLKEPNWQSMVVPGAEILHRIIGRFPLEPVGSGELAGPAREFRIKGAAGVIGVITAVSGHFCGDCNRIRVTSSGIARSCLFAEAGVDLKPFLRGDNLSGLEMALRRIVEIKPGKHCISEESAGHAPFDMSSIGG
ncbi:MAG: GTP 3',8-cyclase MoaA [Geobacteraceae bacterium]